jgi:hypothetical protein
VPDLSGTNILLCIIKQKPQTGVERFCVIFPEETGISVTPVAALTCGASKSSFPEKAI